MPPVSRHLKCGIALYNICKKRSIGAWDRCCIIFIINILLLLLSIKTVFHIFFAIFTLGLCHYLGCAFSMVRLPINGQESSDCNVDQFREETTICFQS